MIIISHEVPKQLFEASVYFNDYPYVLGHLLYGEEFDSAYVEFYKRQLKDNTFSIIDNSGYEKGSSIPNEILYKLGEEYQPSHIILPDVAFNKEETKKRSLEYIDQYSSKSTPKFIGVIQGQGIEDMFEMYDFYRNLPISLIAVSGCIVERGDINRLARADYVKALINRFHGDLPIKLHLLGCNHVNEFLHYRNESGNIQSLDTSAPIIYGWNNIEFTIRGLDLDIKKPTELLANNLDRNLTGEQLSIISNNIRRFRKYVNY